VMTSTSQRSFHQGDFLFIDSMKIGSVNHFYSVCCKKHVDVMAVIDGLSSAGDANNALALVNVRVCYDFDEELLAHEIFITL